MNRNTLAKMKKQLHQWHQERTRCERVAMESSPMVAASFLERKFRPEQKHPYYYLSASIGGESRHRYVSLKEAATWRRRAQRWQHFSTAIARWVKLNREIEKTLRAMGRERCVPLPKGTPRGPHRRDERAGRRAGRVERH